MTDWRQLKVFRIKGTLSGSSKFLAAKSLLKMMKNAFYFAFKTLFVQFFHISIFVLKFWSKFQNLWRRKVDNKQLPIHILPHISRCKHNVTIKFGPLIEYNMKNNFLKNHKQNMVAKLVAESFLKNQNWVYFWINSQVLYCLFLLHVKMEGHRKIMELRCRPLAFALCKAFLKNLLRHHKEVWK